MHASDASDATHPTSSRRPEKQQKLKSVDEMFNPEPLGFDALSLRDACNDNFGFWISFPRPDGDA